MNKDHNKSDTFCVLPFAHVATKTDGSVKYCCRSRPAGNIKNQSLKEIWNSDNYKEVRRQLLNNEKPEACNICWDHEASGVRSRRQHSNERKKDYIKQVEKLNDDYSMPFEIPIFEAKLSNFCNLKCRMCHPLDSTSWASDWTAIQHLMKDNNKALQETVEKYQGKSNYISEWDNNESFWNQFDEISQHIKYIEFAGGEPLIDPIHYKILEELDTYSNDIKLKYATNLTRIDYKKKSLLDIWDNYKEVEVHISIDGVYDSYNYIRQLGNYDEVVENIKKVRTHDKVNIVVGACTLQVYNIFHIGQIFDTFVEELNIIPYTHRVQYPHFLDVRIIPRELKLILTDRITNYIELIKQKNHPNWTDGIKRMATGHLTDAINFLNSRDMVNKLDDFIEFSDTLDQIQNVEKTWRELLPELSSYTKSRGK